MEHHEPSGMYYNWYDEATGEKLTIWPTDGNRVDPFLSSVDNGWLGAALKVVMTRPTRVRPRWPSGSSAGCAGTAFYDTNASRKPGLMHGGFFVVQPPNRTDGFYGNHIGIGPDVWLTNHHYDTTVSETRITSYLGIMTGQVPANHYFAMWRTFPADCGWNWQEMQPVGQNRTYLGCRRLRGRLHLPRHAHRARLGRQHVRGADARHVRARVELGTAQLGTQPPAARPRPARARPRRGRLRLLGLLALEQPGRWLPRVRRGPLGLNPDGYFSDQEKHQRRLGFGECRDALNPTPTFGDGVVTPHASFLAMMHEPGKAFANLAGIQDELKAYGKGGFFDAVAVRSGTIARRYLSLDQAMIMGAIGNVLADNVIRRAFSTRDVERALRPSSVWKSSAQASPDAPGPVVCLRHPLSPGHTAPGRAARRPTSTRQTTTERTPCTRSGRPAPRESTTATSTGTTAWTLSRTRA